jgi:N-acetylglucosamine-6-phosphate deacetylase
LIGELARSGVRASLGHSHARTSEARAAAARGAAGATHLFNAMGPLHHREAGLAGFALSSDALCAEIIGDLVHVGREAFELALRARGPLGLALVSDALHPAGTGCDVFHARGQRIELRDGAAWTAGPEGEPRLAGAAASQMEAIRRLVGRGVVSLPEALRMASEAPAHALGLDAEHGTLAPGAFADLVVIEEAEGGPALREVWLRGRALLARPRPTAGLQARS